MNQPRLTRPAGSRRLAACALLAALASPAAHALILGSCSATANSVAFGTYDLTSPTALQGTSTITVTCTEVFGSTSVTVYLSTGSGTYTTRTMLSGTNKLDYNLYTNAAETTVWGNGTGSTTYDTLTIGNGTVFGSASASATVYGAVPALQNPAPASYTDTITVTVNY
jgi:spore coat protein U-like protein